MKHTEVDYWSKRVKHFMVLDELLTKQQEAVDRHDYKEAEACHTAIQAHLAAYESHISQKKA